MRISVFDNLKTHLPSHSNELKIKIIVACNMCLGLSGYEKSQQLADDSDERLLQVDNIIKLTNLMDVFVGNSINCTLGLLFVRKKYCDLSQPV